MSIRTEPTLRITTDPLSPRLTPTPAGRRFREALGDGGALLLGGVESAARTLPGGELVAGAIAGTADLVGAASGDPSVGSSGAGASSLSAAGGLSSSDDAMALILLQQQMQDENRRFTTLSNVLKARHETAKTAIGNIR